jgi:UDP-N-acetyl-D-glucosamine/UDP-N-acetyl-D-galactosamine dehydrogenase
MKLTEALLSGKEKLSLIGLGYVGLPIAVAFAKELKVIGYDVNQKKIEMYINGIDPTKEVGDEVIKQTSVQFTSNEKHLGEAKFHIVAVPTPVKSDHTPDLFPLMNASRILGRNLKKGSVVVYESTVYPGVTEDICMPILEKESGLKCGTDFKIGYSPERINPGDKIHRLESIIKIVSGIDEETLDIVAEVYEIVAKAGVYRAETIKIAEAAKIIENSQRDINIAFMNELSIIFNKLGIDTKSVLQAASTKWNFLKFYPGLVGGHCIGVDPYYLTYKAEEIGYHSQIILSGRRINDDMGKYIVENVIKNLIKAEIPIKNAKVAIFGFTFKENCPDARNSRVVDIYNELLEYGIVASITDPIADPEEVNHDYNLKLCKYSEIIGIDAAIFAVAHDKYSNLNCKDISEMFSAHPNRNRLIFDIKGIFNKRELEDSGFIYWRL